MTDENIIIEEIIKRLKKVETEIEFISAYCRQLDRTEKWRDKTIVRNEMRIEGIMKKFRPELFEDIGKDKISEVKRIEYHG